MLALRELEAALLMDAGLTCKRGEGGRERRRRNDKFEWHTHAHISRCIRVLYILNKTARKNSQGLSQANIPLMF